MSRLLMIIINDINLHAIPWDAWRKFQLNCLCWCGCMYTGDSMIKELSSDDELYNGPHTVSLWLITSKWLSLITYPIWLNLVCGTAIVDFTTHVYESVKNDKHFTLAIWPCLTELKIIDETCHFNYTSDKTIGIAMWRQTWLVGYQAKVCLISVKCRVIFIIWLFQWFIVGQCNINVPCF